MKRAVLILLTVLALTGCADSHRGPSTGGGGRPMGGNGAPPVPPPKPPLPPPTRDPLGYDHGRTNVDAVAGGQVDALAPSPSPSSGATLAAHAPLDRVTPVSALGVAGAAEVALPAPASSLVTVGAFVFAGAGDPAINGAGDVYRRVEVTPGTPMWSKVVDTQATVAVVGLLDTHAVAAVGGAGLEASLLVLEPSAPAVVSSTSLGRLAPTALTELPRGSGTVFVGHTAGLLRTRQGAVETLALPGVDQTVTALLRVPTTTPGVDALAVAVATFDPVTGAAVSGEVLLGDGTSFTSVLQLTGDAPTCLAFADDALQAGTATGRLLWHDGAAAWQDEPGFAQVERVTSLLVRDARTLVIGARTAGGAVVEVRTRRSP